MRKIRRAIIGIINAAVFTASDAVIGPTWRGTSHRKPSTTGAWERTANDRRRVAIVTRGLASFVRLSALCASVTLSYGNNGVCDAPHPAATGRSRPENSPGYSRSSVGARSLHSSIGESPRGNRRSQSRIDRLMWSRYRFIVLLQGPIAS